MIMPLIGQRSSSGRFARHVCRLLMGCVLVVTLTSKGAAATIFTASRNYDENIVATNAVDRDAFNTAGNAANVADGKIISLSTLGGAVATAFDQDRGGVITFDDQGAFSEASFEVKYGASQTNTMTVSLTTVSGGAPSNTFLSVVDNFSAAKAISGSGTHSNHMGTSSGADFGIAFSQPLFEIGVTILNRTSNRESTVIVVLDDESTIAFVNESQAAWNGEGDPTNDLFFGARAPTGRSITAIRFDNNNAIRIDDLAFTIVPEPSAMMLVSCGMAGIVCVCRRFRRM